MSCFFCDSVYHLPQFCDKYVSDESRNCRAILKDRCSLCLSNIKHTKDSSWCYYNRKCYICFTKNHHSVFCPERDAILSSALFLPNINNDLIPRYMKTMNDEEQLFLPIPIRAAYKFIKLFPIQANVTYAGSNNDDLDRIIVYTNVRATSIDPVFQNMLFKAQTVAMSNAALISEEFLQLLSCHTKEITCSDVNFSTTVSFSDIVKKVPNIKIINFWATEIIIANTWAKDLLEWKRGNNFELLRIFVNDFDFDVDALAAFMKTKSSTIAYFGVYINNSTPLHASKKDELSENLKKYFYQIENPEPDKPYLNVIIANESEYYH